MANILLTGGRAPATLELARIFHKAGHTVYAAESLADNLCASSHAVRGSYRVPPPRQQTAAFILALNELIQRLDIDLLLPTCEEVFYVAMGRAELSPHCTVFVEPLERLRTIHNKWTFNHLAHSYGLRVPQSYLIETQEDLKFAFERLPRLVLKPVYSRFASRTLILPSFSQALSALQRDPPFQWIAQEFIAGEQLCTYSIVHQGHLTAHSAYRTEFTAGQGATIAFKHADHPASLAWVQSFTAQFAYTGQIAMDFIETPTEIYAIECNPRATSGVHLFASHPHFPNAFFDPHQPCLSPNPDESSMLLAAMLLYGLPASLRQQKFKQWLATFITSRDVIFTWQDPIPALFQPASILHYILLGKKRGISALEASTLDIEWNGE